MWASVSSEGWADPRFWSAFSLACLGGFMGIVWAAILTRFRSRVALQEKAFLRLRLGDRMVTFDPDHPSTLFDDAPTATPDEGLPRGQEAP